MLVGTKWGFGGVDTCVSFFMHGPPAGSAPRVSATGVGRPCQVDRADVEPRHEDDWFGDLYRDHRRSTVRLARLLTGSAAAAEDLAHEAFIRVYRRDQPIHAPVPFLRRVTVNVCRDWHRARQREHLRVVRHGPQPEHVSAEARELDVSLALYGSWRSSLPIASRPFFHRRSGRRQPPLTRDRSPGNRAPDVSLGRDSVTGRPALSVIVTAYDDASVSRRSGMFADTADHS
jgi:hypothetical protein